MNPTNPTNPTIVSLIALCEQYREILAVYLFGSHAKGKVRPESDIDLAILLAEPHRSGFDLLAFIAEAESRVGRQVDVVVLNTASELLKYQVRKHGRLLLDRDSAARKTFEIKSRKYFEDFLHLHKKYTKEVRRGRSVAD